jgi:hypothetical protein
VTTNRQRLEQAVKERRVAYPPTRDEEALEEARDKVHAPGATAKDRAEFKRLSDKVAKARVKLRQEEETAGIRPGAAKPEDAAVTPATVKAKGGVHR